ncbi:MAG: hypothetical protein WC444_04775 [Candidatus Paceibacterota bacterium]
MSRTKLAVRTLAPTATLIVLFVSLCIIKGCCGNDTEVDVDNTELLSVINVDDTCWICKTAACVNIDRVQLWYCNDPDVVFSFINGYRMMMYSVGCEQFKEAMMKCGKKHVQAEKVTIDDTDSLYHLCDLRLAACEASGEKEACDRAEDCVQARYRAELANSMR